MKIKAGVRARHKKGEDMKYLTTLVVGAAIAITGVFAGMNATANAASTPSVPECTIKAIGKTNLQTTVGSSYTIDNNVATIHFNVTGPANCESLVTMVSWKAPSLSGSPFDQQKIFKIQRTTVKAGNNQTLSIDTPDCYFQIDTLRGESPYGSDYSKGYGDRQIGSIHGGNKKCVDAPKKVKVCNPANGQIIEVVESEASKYKPVGDIACQPKTPGNVNVCNPANGEIITVTEDKASSYKPVDDAACKEETPTVLPSTGPESALMSMIGAGSIAGSAYAWVQSRRKLHR